MRCPEGHIVTNTTIISFVRGHGCFKCNGNEPWKDRREEFNEKCEERKYKLITDENEWIEGTKKYGNKFKLE